MTGLLEFQKLKKTGKESRKSTYFFIFLSPLIFFFFFFFFPFSLSLFAVILFFSHVSHVFLYLFFSLLSSRFSILPQQKVIKKKQNATYKAKCSFIFR